MLADLDMFDPTDPGTGAKATLSTGETIDIAPRIESGHPIAHRPDPPDGALGIVIAPRIPKVMRDELDAHGWSWIDRRGHIKVRHGSILIDADIPPLPKVPNGLQPADPFAGRAALTVALLALETHPDPLGGIRATARAIGTAPTTASTAIKRLIEAGLLGRDHRAVVPDLFWALTDHWHLPAIGLATTPDVPVEGVVLVGSHAAAALHAPAVTTENHPLELLAADDATARRILRRCGSAPIADAVAYLSIAPTPLSAAPTDRHVRGIPLAAPIVIALGLATDSARGAEIVRNWDWPGRVW